MPVLCWLLATGYWLLATDFRRGRAGESCPAPSSAAACGGCTIMPGCDTPIGACGCAGAAGCVLFGTMVPGTDHHAIRLGVLELARLIHEAALALLREREDRRARRIFIRLVLLV